MARKNAGFTLVEILIVVIILGILAAIVIPQFTEASNDARVSALVSDLQTVRSQVELYKVQHKDCFPGWNGTTVPDGASFVADLTGKTDIDGAAGGTLGPYLGKFPTNGFNNSNAVSIVDAASDPNAVVAGGSGWWFNVQTGNFGVNTLDYIDR